MVVIGVIGVLAAVILPAMGLARASARRVKCRSNLRQAGVALRMYLNQSNDVMPYAAALPSANLNDYPRIADVLDPYLKQPRVLECPEDTEKRYFVSEGSSYEYASMHSGRRVSQSFLTKRFGEQNTPVMYDYEPFHGDAGVVGSANYLFADGHVGDLK